MAYAVRNPAVLTEGLGKAFGATRALDGELGSWARKSSQPE